MKPFKAFLIDRGYDLGLQDHLYVKDNSWGKTRNVDIFELVDEFAKEYQKEIDGNKDAYCDLKEACMVGDPILVCGELLTNVTKCQDGKIYFLDENGNEKWDCGDAIMRLGISPPCEDSNGCL
jgi:hypothetical protein